jgi:hypothetical protein
LIDALKSGGPSVAAVLSGFRRDFSPTSETRRFAGCLPAARTKIPAKKRTWIFLIRSNYHMRVGQSYCETSGMLTQFTVEKSH